MMTVDVIAKIAVIVGVTVTIMMAVTVGPRAMTEIRTAIVHAVGTVTSATFVMIGAVTVMSATAMMIGVARAMMIAAPVAGMLVGALVMMVETSAMAIAAVLIAVGRVTIATVMIPTSATRVVVTGIAAMIIAVRATVTMTGIRRVVAMPAMIDANGTTIVGRVTVMKDGMMHVEVTGIGVVSVAVIGMTVRAGAVKSAVLAAMTAKSGTGIVHRAMKTGARHAVPGVTRKMRLVIPGVAKPRASVTVVATIVLVATMMLAVLLGRTKSRAAALL